MSTRLQRHLFPNREDCECSLELTRASAHPIVGLGPEEGVPDGSPIQLSRGAPQWRPAEIAAMSGKVWSVVVVVIALAGTFAIVNGVHDAGNAIAVPVVTRAIRPGPAVVGTVALQVVGALAVGTAVAASRFIEAMVVVGIDGGTPNIAEILLPWSVGRRLLSRHDGSAGRNLETLRGEDVCRCDGRQSGANP